ncbi:MULTISPECIES: hypothetical protein [unclassified Bacillus (in: firmicutes)]|uniref:hypothetical protein n=1 Tax=unclassified Bacillus (in: firmicutes) TaxID=185979 RepID=UPI001596A0E5|nr:MULTISPECIES: hypothetical protein [unclassified Bacillus (in: firmicutes)]
MAADESSLFSTVMLSKNQFDTLKRRLEEEKQAIKRQINFKRERDSYIDDKKTETE